MMFEVRRLGLLLVLSAILLAACGEQPVVHTYQSVPVNGWEPGDTLRFRVDTLAEGGAYEASIGIRTSASVPYPYRSVWLVVKQHWHNPELLTCDTLECMLTDEKGDVVGHGVSLYQFVESFGPMNLTAGASADVSIYHIMQREMLPGITDVGIKLIRK